MEDENIYFNEGPKYYQALAANIQSPKLKSIV